MNLITGLLIAAAAIILAFRGILLSPHNESFPKAPRLVRSALFLAVVGRGFAAVVFISAYAAAPYAGQAAWLVVLAAAGDLAVNAAMLINILAQRYKPQVWARLNRAADTVRASCENTPAPALIRLLRH